jgi:hypothetical protein
MASVDMGADDSGACGKASALKAVIATAPPNNRDKNSLLMIVPP